MKKILFLGLAIVLVLSLVACTPSEETEDSADVTTEDTADDTADDTTEDATDETAGDDSEESVSFEDAEPIKIGFFGPLTGASAQLGQAERNGVLIAIDEINAAGGLLGRPVELIEYDDKSSPEQAVKAATKLVQADQVTAIVGSLHSGNMLAAGPVLEEYQTPTVGVGTSATWLEQGWEYSFRSISNSQVASKQLAKYAAENEIINIALLHGNDEFGNNGASDFESNAVPLGIEIVADESFTHGDRDFTGQFAKIIASDPDSVLIWCLGDDLGAVTKQLRQAGYDGLIMGCESYSFAEVMDIAGDATNNVVFTAQYLVFDPPEEATDPLMVSFLTAYKERFDEKPASDNAFRGYDAMQIIALGITRANSLKGADIIEQIHAINDYQGLAGLFDFVDNHGEGMDEMRLYEIKGGKYIEIEG